MQKKKKETLAPGPLRIGNFFKRILPIRENPLTILCIFLK